MADSNVPDRLARLWRVPQGTRLGRPAGIDVARVVGTAVELADRDGLFGATLPRIAAAIGVTPMSLYRHIGSKDELLILMADLAYGSTAELPAPTGGWQADLRQWSLGHLTVFQRHPWLAQLPISGPPSGPNAIDWMDAGLRCLRETGLDWSARIGVITVVSGYVRQSFLMGLQLEKGSRAAGLDLAQVERDYGRALVQLVDADRFPDAAALFGSEVFEHAPGDESDAHFAFGLDLILEGIATAIQTAP